MSIPDKKLTRCTWASNEVNSKYHDQEWGKPVHDDRLWFEFLILEGAQAGLSWDTILQKREHYRDVFCGFDAAKVARFDGKKARAAARPGNRPQPPKDCRHDRECPGLSGGSEGTRKLRRIHLEIQQGISHPEPLEDPRASTGENRPFHRVKQRPRKRGFRFVGPTICYALVRATGVVNDHLVSCFRHKELR